MMVINKLINELIKYGIVSLVLDPQNEEYSTNRILDLCKLDSFIKEEVTVRDLDDILNDITSYLYQEKVIAGNDVETLDNFKGKLMDALMDMPNMVNYKFYKQYSILPNKATDYLYKLSKNSNYIQTKRISKNISFDYLSKYGNLQVTINLSKPEKDPRMIALALESKLDHQYPKCQLCVENVGYYGRPGHDGRSNLRAVPIILENETWYLQYSPYSYFNEHAIVLNAIHQPMVINKRAFAKLLSFVDMFPEYFIGSNADLPIVGGSILNHEHFQAGKNHFPIEDAKETFVTEIDKVEVYTLYWPLSTIRLKSSFKENILEVANKYLNKWRCYQNKELEINNSLDDLHNTITPIVRKCGDQYIIDLILRCNCTNELHPLGIFHPHQNLHHIKKENIGLIEAMGLAILPARLKLMSNQVSEYLDGNKDIINQENLKPHRSWILEIEKEYSRKNSYEYVLEKIGEVFMHVLEDAGVFKLNQISQQMFLEFVQNM